MSTTDQHTRFVLISDTHGYHAQGKVPDGDILIHAGDCTRYGQLEELEAFDAYLGTLPHRHKVLVAGNHDWCFQRTPVEARARVRHAVYLQDESVCLDGFHIYGAPWQPWFGAFAFNLRRGPQLAEKWALIPQQTDVLVTHGPPYGVCDTTHLGQHVGCEDLARRVGVVRPALHVFGHIHEARGVHDDGTTAFVNAAMFDGREPAQVWSLPARRGE